MREGIKRPRRTGGAPKPLMKYFAPVFLMFLFMSIVRENADQIPAESERSRIKMKQKDPFFM